jgi:hypothetical protein
MVGIKAAADTSAAATAIFVRVIVLLHMLIRETGRSNRMIASSGPYIEVRASCRPVFRERPPLGITLACGFEIDLHGRSCAMRAMAINSSGSSK